jgi:hypothetical protein
MPLSLLAASAGLAAVGALYFGGPDRAPRGDADDALPLVRPFPFLARVAGLSGPGELALVTLNDGGVHVAGVARALAALPGVEHAARLGGSVIALAGKPGALGNRTLVEASGGSLLRVQRWELGAESRAELARLLDAGDGPGLDEPALRAEFTRSFPGGAVLDARSGALPRAAATPRKLGFTLAELGALASGVRPSRRRGLRAGVYAPHAEARLVFLPPPGVDGAAFAQFQRLAASAGVRATLADGP